MSRPLHRGVSGIRVPGSIHDDTWDSQSKDKSEKDDFDKRGSSDHTPLGLRSPLKLLFSDKENGFTSDPFIVGTPRSRLKLLLFSLKFSLVFIVVLALVGSFWWTLNLSSSSRVRVYHGYRRLQEKLVSDLLDIGEISRGVSRWKELESCSPELENFVPCFNVSDENGFERKCEFEQKQNCLVLPPVNYKVPLRWPTGKDVIWYANVKITAEEVVSSGSLTKRMMMLDNEQISFRSASDMFDGVEDYSHQIAEMIGLRNESSFIQAGIRTVLDIGCGYGSFGAHLLDSQLLTLCIANYEPSGSQVQLTLERGLPAMIASFTSKQLPYPSLSFDMLHCARCGIDWDQKDGNLLIEADRLLRPGGYFVWTSPLTNARNKENQKRLNFVHDFTENLCWEMLPQQDETVVWKKASKKSCYTSRKRGSRPLCGRGIDVESPYYRELQNCIGGTQSNRWVSIEKRGKWPSRANLNKNELAIHGLLPDEFSEDSDSWKAAVQNYWSLLSPLIFSDHPKRPGDEDPTPPYNMFRNVLDMNANFGGFNSALLQARKSVWVMNVVSINGPNYLPLIHDRGFVGVLHDWCEPFPTYPRTYDLVHAAGLLSLEFSQPRRCTMLDLFIEIDRLLRPEGWFIIRDTVPLVESARALTTQLKWEARVIEIESNSEEKLLICQKPFFKRHAS
ncbi:putative pectin methyltransferase QUA2 [Trifolium repens]|nr:putative pectin methyltransferase QUA2 [Trifolium repens]